MARRGVKFRVKTTGVYDVLAALGAKAAKELAGEFDEIVEKNAVKIVNQTKENAPIRDGFLRNSIHIYGRPAKMARIIGSDRDYATRQEYEHATKKGFFRKALWAGRVPLRDDIKTAIKSRGR
jgi:hypothetical protein